MCLIAEFASQNSELLAMNRSLKCSLFSVCAFNKAMQNTFIATAMDKCCFPFAKGMHSFVVFLYTTKSLK